MEVVKSEAVKYKITDVPNLDLVTVFCDDLEPGKGKIVIECYGKSWSAYWGGMSGKTVAEFFCGCNNGYLIDKLAPQLQSTVTDYANLDRWLQKAVVSDRRHLVHSKKEARRLWDDIDSYCHCENDASFIHSTSGSNLMLDIIGDEWWHCLPEAPCSDYNYLSRIVDAVKAGLSQTEEL